MTVAQLIEKLEKCSPSSLVYYEECEDSITRDEDYADGYGTEVNAVFKIKGGTVVLTNEAYEERTFVRIT